MSRFAIVGPIHPLRGGIAQHTLGIVAEARARGHAMSVHSYRRQYPGVVFPGRSQLDEGPGAPEAAQDVSRALDSLAPRTWMRVASEIAERTPEMVLLQRWHPFFAPLLASIAWRVRATARVTWLVHNARPHEQGRLWGPALRLGYHETDQCIVHADTEAHALRELGVTSSVTCVPMPTSSEVRRVDPLEARARLGLPADGIVFLFFGYVRAYKGVDVLVEALGRLASEGAPWSAVLAGEWYLDPAPTLDRIRALGLSERVQVLDQFVSQATTDDCFAAADVVVLPYRSGTQSAVVPLAYGYGRPVVTTRVGGLPEAVQEGETGLLVPPGDPDRLAAALERVRQGHRFSSTALAAAHHRASFGTLVDTFESIVQTPRFP